MSGGDGKKRKLKALYTAVSLALCAAMLISARGEIVNFAGRLAFFSAAAAMPREAAIELISYEPPQTQPQPEADTSEAGSQTTTEAPKKKTSAKGTDLTVTPEDISALMKSYAEKAAKETEDGKISEKDYHTSGATDSNDNVYVKNINETKVDIAKELSAKADLQIADKELPYVLIIHSHTTEAYQIIDRDFYAAGYKTRSNSSDTNMARVGFAIAEEIEKAGYKVIHDEKIYDTTYSGSYPRSREAIKQWMEKYPSIRIVLDVHRDAIQVSGGVKIKPTAVINGKKAAQIMIISGCQEEGNSVEDFPDWQQNLTFAVQLQKQMEDMYSGLTRPIYFSPRKYNMDLTHCSLLVEMGSDANTLEEAVYSGRMLGTSVAALMEKYAAE